VQHFQTHAARLLYLDPDSNEVKGEIVINTSTQTKLAGGLMGLGVATRHLHRTPRTHTTHARTRDVSLGGLLRPPRAEMCASSPRSRVRFARSLARSFHKHFATHGWALLIHTHTAPCARVCVRARTKCGTHDDNNNNNQQQQPTTPTTTPPTTPPTTINDNHATKQAPLRLTSRTTSARQGLWSV
jgi:hypothetical protein